MRFALLSPRVRQGIGLGGDANDGNRLSINAGSYRHTAYLLDGAVNYDWIYANGPQQTVSVGAVEEFKVLSGQYAAEFGTSTSGVLMVAARSGTNDLHGEAFLLGRPAAFRRRLRWSTQRLRAFPTNVCSRAPRRAVPCAATARSYS